MPSGKISASAIAVSGALLRGTIKVFANKCPVPKSVAERCSLRSQRILCLRFLLPVSLQALLSVSTSPAL